MIRTTITVFALLAAGPAFPQAAAWLTDGRTQPSSKFPQNWQNRTEVPGAITLRDVSRAEFITGPTPQVHVELLDMNDHGTVVAKAYTQNEEGGWDRFAREVYSFRGNKGRGDVETFDVVPGTSGLEAPVKVVLKNRKYRGEVNNFTVHISAEAACAAMRPEIIGQNVHLSPINPREEGTFQPNRRETSASKPDRSERKSRGDRRVGKREKGKK